MEKNPLNPARSLDLRQIVYEKIKQAVVEGVIKPGEKLSEIDLAEKMAVSRTPVREAIRQLAKTGLVTLTPRRGAFVAEPTLADASALYELREDLEVFAVSLVAQHPPLNELLNFRKIFSSMDDSIDPQEYLKEDRNFHLFLYEASGNRFLKAALLDLIDMINLYRPYSLAEQNPIKVLCDSHTAIIDALLNHDEQSARREMGAHIRMNRSSLEQYLSSYAPGNFTRHS